MNPLLNSWSQWVSVSVHFYLVSLFYGVYFISNIVTFSGVDVASQFQFLSCEVLWPPGHLVWGNTGGISRPMWGYVTPCRGWVVWKLFLNHFKYILWHMKLKTCWKLKIYIFYKIQYGQVVWPVLYFYQNSAKLKWHSPHRGSSHCTTLHFLFPSPPPSFQSFSHFSEFFCYPSVGPCTPFVSSVCWWPLSQCAGRKTRKCPSQRKWGSEDLKLVA